jgi:hypothetical protein
MITGAFGFMITGTFGLIFVLAEFIPKRPLASYYQTSVEQKAAQLKFDIATKDATERFKELQLDETFMENTCRSIRSVK